MKLEFRAVNELKPGPKWQDLFEEYWPAFRRWYLLEGDAARPRYADCLRMLRQHMPEMVPIWSHLAELVGGGNTATRFLSLYRPPPYLCGCSQAIWSRHEEVALVRNYDYAPHLCDGVVLLSAWSGTAVIATTDCLIGVLDGMNEHGLAVALAFGGRRVRGDGFGIAIVLRYILESCTDTAEAVKVLRRVPVHMTYTVAVVDRHGDSATVFVAPDRSALVTDRIVSTNHQLDIEWPQHAQWTQTQRRERYLRACLSRSRTSLEDLIDRFLLPPLYRRQWNRGSGTLYTSVCRPRHGVVDYLWPDSHWSLSMTQFREQRCIVRYATADGPTTDPRPPSAAARRE